MKNQEQIILLFRKYLEQLHTEEELDEILQYFQLKENDGYLVQLIEQELDNVPDSDPALIKSIGDEVAHNLFKQTRSHKIYKIRRWLPYAAAVLVFFVFGLVLYHFQFRSHTDNILTTENIILPGSNRATITLSDGQVLTLSEDHEGVVNKDDALVYTDGSPIKLLEATQLVTLTTPRAGQYAITLSDGTRVRLNAASELIYPTHFDENERVVQLKGEAYFEVAKNEKHPFKVQTKDCEILVTGTQFNITAYDDEESTTTTLVEGGVLVTNNGSSVNITPGYQAIISPNADYINTKMVDTDYALAWLHGDFLFEDQDIQSIMKNASRWYDVDVSFKGTLNTQKFGGTYTRTKGLHELLQHLEALSNYNIRFEVNERKVIVMM